MKVINKLHETWKSGLVGKAKVVGLGFVTQFFVLSCAAGLLTKQEVKTVANQSAEQEVKVEKRVEAPKYGSSAPPKNDKKEEAKEIALLIASKMNSKTNLFKPILEQAAKEGDEGLGKVLLGVVAVGCGYGEGEDLPDSLVVAAKETMSEVGCERALRSFKGGE